jgi:formylmethanofuran dehydrogenase subunit E
MDVKDLSEVVAFHGHVCPGLAFGYRVAVTAMENLGMDGRREALVAVVENRSCAVDAIQVVTGCTFGKGNLILEDYGKQVYSFMAAASGQGVRIAVIWQQPPESAEMQEVWRQFNSGNYDPQIMRQIKAHKGGKVRQILEAPDHELLKVEKRQFVVPPPAQVYPSLRCSKCQEKVMAPQAMVEGETILCIPCQQS